MNQRSRYVAAIVFSAVMGFSEVSVADTTAELEELKRTVNRQERVIQQLTEKLGQLEARVGEGPVPASVSQKRVSLAAEELAALPATAGQKGDGQLPLEIGGYIDFGYINAAGSGTTSTTALQINSRGDNLADVGLDGDSSFLINDVDLDFKAHVSQSLDAVASLDFLPRNLSFTTSGGTAQTDSAEVRMAYVVYAPFSEPSSLTDMLFGDLRLSLGKFESPIGFEYRYNKSPDRVNISRALPAVWTTGYPVGIRARGNLLQGPLSHFHNSLLTYNVVLANADPFISSLSDGDRDTNSNRTIMGRLSYGLDIVGGFFETGVSLLQGARIGQGDNKTETSSIDLDGRFEWGPLTLRAEYAFLNQDRPRTGGSAAVFSGFGLEGFYTLERPHGLPAWIPMTSLTPFYRYDVRDANTTPATGSDTVQLVKRHTFALRYTARPGSILKAEYQLVGEAEDASVNDNVFLASFVQQF